LESHPENQKNEEVAQYLKELIHIETDEVYNGYDEVRGMLNYSDIEVSKNVNKAGLFIKKG